MLLIFKIVYGLTNLQQILIGQHSRIMGMFLAWFDFQAMLDSLASSHRCTIFLKAVKNIKPLTCNFWKLRARNLSEANYR